MGQSNPAIRSALNNNFAINSNRPPVLPPDFGQSPSGPLSVAPRSAPGPAIRLVQVCPIQGARCPAPAPDHSPIGGPSSHNT